MVMLFAVMFTCNTYVLKHEIVSGSSMYPALEDGQPGFGLVIGKEDIKRNDIVAIDIDPDGKHYCLVKRVIGLPGETVKYEGGILYINGVETEDEFGFGYTDDFEITAGPGEIVALGDNREHSSDSRTYGAFPIKNIISKGFYKFLI